jgi:hypothetical protein
VQNILDLPKKDLKKLESTFIEMKKRAEEDPVYFFDTFLYTFNPKQEPFHLRFKTFPFQKRLIRDIINAVKNGEDIFIEKCREMGVSYTILGTFLWLWLFEPASNFLIGSRKEDYVDNRRGGTTGNKEESLFGKLDYMLSRLPSFMLPQGFNQDKHFNYMSLVNPENGNVISGESSNENFSRGGRQRAILLDEFAFWDNANSVWGATADTTNCRIVATTPGIKPSKAKRLRFGKDGEKIKLITLTYKLDPRKNKSWLEDQRKRRSTEDFNREIMVNWETSITGRVYPEIENAAYGDFPFFPNQPLYCSGDYGLDGTCFIFWQQNKANGKWRIVDGYVNEGKVIQFYFPLFGKPIDSKFVYTDDDLKAITEISQYPQAIHFGDTDVKKKSFIKSSSTILELQKIGVYVQSLSGEDNKFVNRREKTKIYLSKGIEINASARTDYLLEAFKMYRYPQRAEDSQATTPIIKPIHDWCLAGNTKIRTLNGWIKIKDLVDKNFYVWGYSNKHKRMIPTKAKKCWKVGKKKTIKIVLDNNNFVRCTPEHKFLLRSGKYVMAKDIRVGMRLMPFYDKPDRTYVDVSLNDGSHGLEHRIVFNYIKGFLKENYHIHHLDGNKHNNNPNNLQQISKEKHCSITKPQNGEKISQTLKIFNAKNKKLKKCPVCKKIVMMSYKQTYCSKKCQQNFYNKIKKSDYKVNAKLKKCVQCGKDFLGYSRQKTCCKKCADLRKKRYNKIYQQQLSLGNKIKMTNADIYPENHKVLNTVKDNKEVLVYDIEVPETKNFVAEGVIVHNCSHPSTAMEYFFINIDVYETMQFEQPSWADQTKTWITNKLKLRG